MAVPLEEQLFDEFTSRIRSEVEERIEEVEEQGARASDIALAEVFIGYLEEAGLTSDHTLCPHEDTTGRNRCKVIAYSLAEDATTLELFTAEYISGTDGTTIGSGAIEQLMGRAARFFQYVTAGDFSRFEESENALGAARYIAEALPRIEAVRVHVLTNGLARERDVGKITISGRDVSFSICDVERLYRATRGTVTRDVIEVDFEQLMGRPIASLEMQGNAKSDYETFLLVLPGEVIYQLYEQFGARLFEFNVRSFLQAKGKVNKGIRETLKNEPERFLAYNNGLTATADEIEACTYHGETAIRRLKGLQIVNGAQTTASIHRAKKFDRLPLDNVAVSMKLTRVAPDKLSEFVPLIARFANTQNVIQIADLSANNDFHIRLEQLSEKTWCPGEENRWFYERARGAYQVAAARYGTTQARRRDFESECPKSQHFSKTDLAKYLMSWWQLPNVVSRGAQKNFAVFMADLPTKFAEGWQPDEAFYKQAVSLAILFKAVQVIVRKAKLQSYGANVVTYTVAKLSFDCGESFDLEWLWENQEVSPELEQALSLWVPLIHAEIVSSAGRSNVTEWCKKEACWEHIKGLVLDMPAPVPPEMPAPTEQQAPDEPKLRCNSPIDLCCAFDAAAWARIVAWAAESPNVNDFHKRVANTLAGYALNGWRHRPSDKQARIGEHVLRAASAGGIVTL